MFNKLKEINNLISTMKEMSKNAENLNSVEDVFEKLGLDRDFIESSLNQHFMKSYTLRYIKIDDSAVTPKFNYESDSGFDLHSIEKVTIEPLGRALVRTGLKFEIPLGAELQIRPKSGLALKEGLTVLNTPGTVDQGYTGEVMVIVFNTNNFEYTIEKGMKIAQAVLCPVIAGRSLNLHNVVEINEKDRGSNGFGSTGI